MMFPTNPRFGRRVALSAAVTLVSLFVSGTVLAQQAATSTKTNTSRVPPQTTMTAKLPAKTAPVVRTMEAGDVQIGEVVITAPPPIVEPVNTGSTYPLTGGGGSGTPPAGGPANGGSAGNGNGSNTPPPPDPTIPEEPKNILCDCSFDEATPLFPDPRCSGLHMYYKLTETYQRYTVDGSEKKTNPCREGTIISWTVDIAVYLYSNCGGDVPHTVILNEVTVSGNDNASLTSRAKWCRQ